MAVVLDEGDETRSCVTKKLELGTICLRQVSELSDDCHDESDLGRYNFGFKIYLKHRTYHLNFVDINFICENVRYVIPIKYFLQREEEIIRHVLERNELSHLNKISVSLDKSCKGFHSVVSQVDDI